MSDASRGRVAEVVTGAIHLFALTVVVRLLLFAYSEVRSLRETTLSNAPGAEAAGMTDYYSFVLAAVFLTLTLGGGPFALVVLGRNLSGEDGRLTEIGLAAAFVSLGLFRLVVPVSLPFEARLACGVALGVLGVALPLAVGYRYYAER